MDASFWDERFSASETDFVYGAAPNAFVERESRHLPPGASVLALGAGEGRNAVFLAERGFDVTALDYSAAGLDKARRLALERGVRIQTVQADVTTWTPERVWNAVVTTFLHLPATDHAALYARMRAALRPGGLLLAEWFHPRQRTEGYESGGPPAPEMMVTPETLAEHFGPHGTLLLCQEAERTLSEGPYHRGPAALTQLVWQRQGDRADSAPHPHS